MAKILLVEDDTNLSEIYQARMEAEGYEVVSAADGESALAIAAKERPDLIISDVMMPKISGFEMLDILRNTTGLKDTPVIMLTALGQADDKGRADQLGANRYLVKSQVTLEDIVNAAHQLLEDDGSEQPLPAAVAEAVGEQAPATEPAAPAVEAEPAAEPTEPEQSAEPAATPEAEAEPVPEPVHEERAALSGYERREVAPVHVPTATSDDAATDDSATDSADEADDSAAVNEPAEPITEESAPAPEPTDTAAEVPAEAPAEPEVEAEPAKAAENHALDEDIVAGTVDKLLKKSPKADKEESKNGLDPKKVISPISKPGDAPDLDALLAKEEAKEKAAEAGNNDSDDKKSNGDPNDIAL